MQRKDEGKILVLMQFQGSGLEFGELGQGMPWL
jgi:hypothetical protein